MAKLSATPHREILEAALHGLEAQRHKLDEQIAQVQSMLGRRPAGRPAKSAGVTLSVSGAGFGSSRKRVLSPEARKRIADAQKKRWAAFRKNKG